MNSKELLVQSFLPDPESSYSLSTIVVARSGSGKTTLLRSLLLPTMQMEDFKEVRFVYVSLKGDYVFTEGPYTQDLSEAVDSIGKNKWTTFAPHPENYDIEVDLLLNEIFEMAHNSQAEKERPKFQIIMDDANILRKMSNQARPSPAIIKAAVAARSMGIRLTVVLHKLGNAPRIFNGNASSMILMKQSEMDVSYGEKIFGMNFGETIQKLEPYHWVHVDLISENMTKFAPVKPL